MFERFTDRASVRGDPGVGKTVLRTTWRPVVAPLPTGRLGLFFGRSRAGTTTPVGGLLSQLNVGGCAQFSASPKSTVPPENPAPVKLTGCRRTRRW